MDKLLIVLKMIQLDIYEIRNYGSRLGEVSNCYCSFCDCFFVFGKYIVSFNLGICGGGDFVSDR